MSAPTPTSIMTVSGRYFDPINPDPAAVHLPDIAWALGRIRRFNGHTDAPEDPDPLTVDSHSMRVARIGDQGLTFKSDADRAEQLLGLLLHDAPEGYMGDIVRPLKTDRHREIEAGVLEAIVTALVPNPTKAARVLAVCDSPLCHFADDLALTMEALIFQRGAVDWAMPSSVDTRAAACEALPLFWPRHGEDWRAEVITALNAVIHEDLHPLTRSRQAYRPTWDLPR